MSKVAVYLRVSTHHQNTESQLTAIKTYLAQAGIVDYAIYEDIGISGAKQSRPSLDKMMADVRSGIIDTVCVYALSRYARSMVHLLTALNEFRDLGTNFISITEQLDTNSPMGRAIFGILASIAELEKNLIVERVKAGLFNARSKGIKLGAPKKVINRDLLNNLATQGLSHREISKFINVSASTIGRELKLIQKVVA